MASGLTKRVRNIARFRDIMAVLAAHGFGELVDELDLEERAVIRAMLPSPSAETKGLTRWQRVTRAMEQLGPTFVKLGQILSTRNDLLPDEAIVELKKLQAHVKPESFDKIREAIESSLDDELDSIFAEVDREPLAAASMAQVHRAKLKDGRRVVLKVLRPGIREVVENDLDILRLLAALSERIPELKPIQPRAVVREFERAMLLELDLTHELANIRRFRDNFRDVDTVRVPEPVDELSGRNVITMELLEGVPFTEYAKVGADREKLAKRAIGAVFKMAFEDGFFHADPHPGNVLALPDSRIGVLDMGQAGRLDRVLRDKVVGLLSALVRDDPERIAEAVYAFGETTGSTDFGAFRKDVIDVYEIEVRGRPIKDLAIGRILGQLTRIASRHKIKIPADLALVFKAVVTMEGVAKEIYPELDIMQEATPYVKRLMLERYSPERLGADFADILQASHGLLQALPRRLDRLLGDLEQGRLVVRVEEADPKAKAKARERIAARNALGIAAGGLALGAALLLTAGWHALGTAGMIVAAPLLLWTFLAAARPRS